MWGKSKWPFFFFLNPLDLIPSFKKEKIQNLFRYRCFQEWDEKDLVFFPREWTSTGARASPEVAACRLMRGKHFLTQLKENTKFTELQAEERPGDTPSPDQRWQGGRKNPETRRLSLSRTGPGLPAPCTHLASSCQLARSEVRGEEGGGGPTKVAPHHSPSPWEEEGGTGVGVCGARPAGRFARGTQSPGESELARPAWPGPLSQPLPVRGESPGTTPATPIHCAHIP